MSINISNLDKNTRKYPKLYKKSVEKCPKISTIYLKISKITKNVQNYQNKIKTSYSDHIPRLIRPTPVNLFNRNCVD